jgi:glycosyltransferase involved in cell wall biosynthesis
VLLPVRDAQTYLEQCRHSLGRQTLADYEVVAVDDGSGDRSGEMLDGWAGEDSRVRVIHQPPDGLIAALNVGLAACRASFVARMDADDVSHPDRLKAQVEFLESRPDVGVISCRVQHFPRHGVGEGFLIYERWLNSMMNHRQMARQRFIESPLAHPSATIRSTVLMDAGGYRDHGWPEDYDLWLRLFHRGVRFAKLDRPLFFWREHPKRLTRRNPRYSTDAFLRCKARYLSIGPLHGSKRVIVWGAGQTGRRLARYLIAQGVIIDAFMDIDKDKIGRRARGRPILSLSRLPEIVSSETVVLAAVASRGARQLIRQRLGEFGLAEGEGFWCVA